MSAELCLAVFGESCRRGSQRRTIRDYGEPAVELMHQLRSRIARRDERGASLIMALVFITSLAFMALTTLDIGDSAAREDRATQTVHTDVYGGAGALDVYINAMRSTLKWGREGLACVDLTYTLSDGRTAAVSCTPVHGSGALIQNGAGAYTDRIVDLVVVIDGRAAATAQIEFVDGGGASPGTVVKTRHWNTAR